MEETVMNLGILKYECDICEKICTDVSSLDHHVSEHRPLASTGEQIKLEVVNTENGKCIHKEQEQLEPHVDGTLKIEETVLKYECNICESIFTDVSSLDNHVNVHHQYDWNKEPVRSLAISETQIKVEISNTENDQLSRQDEQFEPYADGAVKIEETGLNWPISKYECNTDDEMFTDKFGLEDPINVSHRDFIENSVQSLTSREHQNEVELCKFEQTNSFKSNTELSINGRPFKCERAGCRKSFKTKWELTAHMTVHSDIRPFKCEQTGCNKSFKRRKDLLRHKGVHSDEKPFECEICTQSFKNRPELTKHMRVHSSERPFKCNQIGCVWSFKTHSELIRHIRRHHDSKPFKCDQAGCLNSFELKRDLMKHMMVHSNESPIESEQTGLNESFENRDLSRYKRDYTLEKSFICTQSGCSKAFKSKKEINAHMTVHSHIRPFKCEHTGCNKSFKGKRDLSNHKIVHRVNKAYKCEEADCTLAFKSKSELTRHIKWHTNERPFKCDIRGCTKTFKIRHVMERHKRLHNDGRLLKFNETDCKQSLENKSLDCHMKFHADETQVKHEEDGLSIESEITFKIKLEPDDELKMENICVRST